MKSWYLRFVGIGSIFLSVPFLVYAGGSNHTLSQVTSTSVRLTATTSNPSGDFRVFVQASAPSIETSKTYGGTYTGSNLLKVVGSGSVTDIPLTPNTPYQLSVSLDGGPNEPNTPLRFNTKPATVTPDVPAFVPSNYSLRVKWVDSQNPWWTTYEIGYCLPATTTLPERCRTAIRSTNKGTSPSQNPSNLSYDIQDPDFEPGQLVTNITVKALNYSKQDIGIDLLLKPDGDAANFGQVNLSEVGPLIGSISGVQISGNQVRLETTLRKTGAGTSNVQLRWTGTCQIFTNYHVALTACRPMTITAVTPASGSTSLSAGTVVPVQAVVTVRNGGRYTWTLEANDGTVSNSRSTAELYLFATLSDFTLSPATVNAGTRQRLTFRVSNPVDNFGDSFGVLSRIQWDIPGANTAVFDDNSKSKLGTSQQVVIAGSELPPSSFVVRASSQTTTFAGPGAISKEATVNIVTQTPEIACSVSSLSETEALITVTGRNLNSGGADTGLSYSSRILEGPSLVNLSQIELSYPSNNQLRVRNLQRAGNFKVEATVTLLAFPDVSASCEVPFTINSVTRGLRVCPTNIPNCPSRVQIKNKRSEQFTAIALDQFGNAFVPGTSDIQWRLDGQDIVGARSSAISFTPTGYGDFRLEAEERAVSPTLTGFITLASVDFDVAHARGSPVPWKSTDGGGVYFTCLGTQSKIQIFTITGRLVKEITHVGDNGLPFAAPVDAPSCVGHELWTVRNEDSEKVASGVYLYRIESPDNVKNGKLIIIQ